MKMKSLAVLSLLAVCLAGACSPTKMQKTWKAPDFERGSIRKVLVIGVFKTPGARETVEGQFVQQLQEERLEAVASNAYLSDTELSRDTIVQKVQELNFDGVVLSRAIDRQTFEKYYGPSQEKAEFPVGNYDEWYKQYVENVESRDAIGYTVDRRVDVQVETRLFDARTQKLVWAVVSGTRIDGRDPRQIQDAVGAILESMRRGVDTETDDQTRYWSFAYATSTSRPKLTVVWEAPVGAAVAITTYVQL